ncbi:MAG: methyltransferase [Chitinophagales bacterium]|nr:methyltransferase [Chitinophagales bacterium]
MKVTTDACVFGAWVDVPRQGAVLDAGTGTGLLALMVAQRCPLPVDAVELHEPCAAEAAENFRNSPWGERLRLHCADIRTFTSDCTYSLMISNPPFFVHRLAAPDPARRQARHRVSLLPQELFAAANRLLQPQSGKLAVLWPADERQQLMNLAARNQFFAEHLLFIASIHGRPPHRIACMFCRKPQEIQTQTIAIHDRPGRFSSEMHQLLAAYYVKW